jgi:hypothetical protein
VEKYPFIFKPMFSTKFFILTILLITSPTISMSKTLLKNGHFYGLPNVRAVSCENGKIASLSPNLKNDFDAIIDLQDGWVYPGFTDGHMHLSGLGWSLEILDLVGTKDKRSILKILKSSLEKVDKDTWIQGRGWDQNDWEEQIYPTARDLDKVSPNHPVVLRRIDGHALWANTKAMQLAGLEANIKNLDGGKIIRDEKGKPTGIFIDNAMDLITGAIPKASEKDILRYTKKAQTLLNSLGVTSVHDAGTSKKDIKAYQDLLDKNELSVRIYAMLNDIREDYEFYLENGPVFDKPFLNIRALKVYMDGALGSRGAALLEPYSDAPNESGFIFMSDTALSNIVKKFNNLGFQVNTHGIGDRAIRQILNAYEISGFSKMRNRIEHAQIVHPLDLLRFKPLGVIPAMQATHCTSDMPWADERLGKERLTRAYPWQSFSKLGLAIPGGSDAPVEYPDPLAGIYSAITRQDKTGWPKGGWQAQERLSLEQAIQSYTTWPAYASFEENVKGKIEVGYYADFTVLGQALSTENPKLILETKVTHTIVNGKIVYRAHD